MNDTNADKTEFLKTLLEFGVIGSRPSGNKGSLSASLKAGTPLLDYLTVRDLLIRRLPG